MYCNIYVIVKFYAIRKVPKTLYEMSVGHLVKLHNVSTKIGHFIKCFLYFRHNKLLKHTKFKVKLIVLFLHKKS